MNREQNLKNLKRALFIIVLLTTNLIVFTITAFSYRNKTSNAKIHNNDKGGMENDKVIVKNISSWRHPIKKYFKDSTLIKVELLYKRTYPIFYIDDNTLSEEDVAKNYTSDLYASMLEANGYWDFEIRTLDNKWVKVKGDKKEKKLIEIVFDGKSIDLSQYEKTVAESN